MINATRKKFYVAGKITGYPEFKETFQKAVNDLEEKGYIVINPADLPSGMTPGDYMRICFAMIDSCDMLYFLPNYIDSPGAQLELAYARYIGKPCHFNLGGIGPLATYRSMG